MASKDLMKRELLHLREENRKLRSKINEVTDDKMKLYGNYMDRQVQDIVVENFQRLIFSEIQRSNEINTALLSLIKPQKEIEREAIEMTVLELGSIREDSQLPEDIDDPNFIEKAEKQIRFLIEILQFSFARLKKESPFSECTRAVELKTHKMIEGLEKILNPPSLQPLNSTLSVIESSLEAVESDKGQMNIKIPTTIVRSQSNRTRMAAENEEKLLETIKQKDGIIQSLYVEIGSLNKSVEEFKRNQNRNGNWRQTDQKIKELKEDNRKIDADLRKALKDKEILDQKNKELVQDLQKASEVVKKLENDLRQCQSEKDENLSLMKKKGEEIDELKEKIFQLENDLKTKTEEIKSFMHRVQNQVDKNPNSYDSTLLKVENEKLTTYIAKMNADYQQVVEKKQILEKENQELINALLDGDVKRKKLEEESFQREDDKQRLNYLLKEKSELKEEIFEYQRKLSKMDAEITRLKMANAVSDDTEGAANTSNPFIRSDKRKTGKPERNFWLEDLKRNLREKEETIMEKDEIIERLQIVIRDMRSQKKPRSNNSINKTSDI